MRRFASLPLSRANAFALVELAAYACFAAGVVIGMRALQRADPVRFASLLVEDGVVEYAGALGFLLGAVLLGVCAARPGAWPIRAVWGLMALAMLFVGMEEISWGQRILGFATPAAFRESNLQGEFTFHNLRPVRELNPIRFAPTLLLGWLGVSLAAQVLWRREADARCARIGIPLAPLQLTPIVLLPCLYLALRPSIIRRMEVSECLLGLVAAAYAVYAVLSHLRGRPGARPLATGAAFAAIAAVGGMLALLSDASPAAQLNRAAVYGFPKFGMHAQALRVFEHLEANPQLRAPGTRLAHAELLIELDRESDAAPVLARLAEELSAARPEEPERAEVLRRLARVRTLQGDRAAAEAAYDASLRVDRERLAAAEGGDETANLLWSIAQTQLARGDSEAAFAVAREAMERAESAARRYAIRRWVERSESELPTDP